MRPSPGCRSSGPRAPEPRVQALFVRLDAGLTVSLTLTGISLATAPPGAHGSPRAALSRLLDVTPFDQGTIPQGNRLWRTRRRSAAAAGSPVPAGTL